MVKLINCKKCGLLKPHYGKYMCQKCYQRYWNKNNLNYQIDYRHKNKINKSVKDKKSYGYLGDLSESIIDKIYPDAIRMPYGNRGFDFICNKGYVDVKASCRILVNNKSDNWHFKINKNKIPDYFLCLAFDNRDDLNPEHIWLISGNVISDKQLISISESRINKWDEYKLNINKIIKYYNIRGNMDD